MDGKPLARCSPQNCLTERGGHPVVETGDNKRACHFSLARQFFVSVLTFLTKKLRDSSNFRFRTLSREEMRRAERWTLGKRGKTRCCCVVLVEWRRRHFLLPPLYRGKKVAFLGNATLLQHFLLGCCNCTVGSFRTSALCFTPFLPK